MRRIYLLALFLLFVLASFLLGIKAGEVYPLNSMLNIIPANSQDDNNNEPSDAMTEEPEEAVGPDLQSINLVIVGNIFPHLPQIEQAHLGDGVYDFTPSFEYIAPLLQVADLAVADLETSQAGPDISYLGFSGYTGFPMFNTPQELSVALREAGIDVMTLGNNHALDRGYEGLVETLNHLRGIGIRTFGAYKSQEERDTTLIIDQNGLKIAFIGYTFSTNGIPVPEGHEYCINFSPGFTDTTAIIEDINQAKSSGADLIAFFPHWGEDEYAQEPQPQYYRQVAEELAAAGADLIIGGHPKFIQPLEWFFNERADGTERATLAIYAQGTFLSNQHYPANISPLVEYGLLLDIDLTKNLDSGEAWISGVEYEVTWIHREWRHRILPLTQVFSASPESLNLSASKIEDLKSWHQRCIDTAEAYGHLAGKAKAMEISEQLINKAHNN